MDCNQHVSQGMSWFSLVRERRALQNVAQLKNFAAFRQKMRDDAAKAQVLTSTEEYERHTQFANDVAEFLRKNIIQGVKVAEGNQGDDGTWCKLVFIWICDWKSTHGFQDLPIHDETELGSNESIKNPKVMESSRSASKREEWTNPIWDFLIHNSTNFRCSSGAVQSEQSRPLYYSALKKASQERVIPEIREEDLEESFARGKGLFDPSSTWSRSHCLGYRKWSCRFLYEKLELYSVK